MPHQRTGCLFGFLANLLGHRPDTAAAPPKVMVNKFFITDAERNFFLVLRQVVGTRAHILAQVSLNQLLYFLSAPNRQAWKNRASQRAIDFVLCHAATLRPLLAIELDDSTHTRPDRQTRDLLPSTSSRTY